jgi:ribosomal protein S18 acetylase RimI-like enzyme
MSRPLITRTTVSKSQEPAVALEWTDVLETVNWEELSALYRVAPLGNKSPANLKTAFSNSMFRCFVYEAGRLVGVGRALADGIDCSYICDVAVMPSHQGTGLGKQIVGKLVELSKGHKKIILYAVPGKEPFYRKFGFMRMKTAMAIFEDQALAFERGYLSET